MNDLISRQSAIDSLNEERCPCESDYDEGYLSMLDKAIWIIKEWLPSAQPEIIRCGQCKYAEVADKEDAQDVYTCQFHRGSIWFSGSYCSWAERRTDG